VTLTRASLSDRSMVARMNGATGLDDEPPAHILVVDDNRPNRELMEAYLETDGYRVTSAANGNEAFRLVREIRPDLVLLDVMMPGVSGYDVCAALKADETTRLIPIILLTALGRLEDRLSGIEAGADEFLTKPCNKTELLTRIRTLTRVKRLNDQLESAENVVLALARAIEAKDPYTEGHVERVSRSARALGERLGLPRLEVETLAKAGFLHDVGKIGVRESVLLKPGPLTPEERQEIERHSVLGEEICRPLRSAANLLAAIRHHHERIDGRGYPDGLSGDAIPVAARVLAIVDAFDAMTSDRPYRPGMGVGEALAVLRRYAGQQWDAEMVEVFAALIESEGAPSRA
jgi:putative two-component system response regulator